MPTGFKDITVTKTEGNDGVDIGDIPGDGGIGPSSWVFAASATGLPANNPFISLQIFPSGELSSGTDENGSIGVLKTFINNGDDKLFGYSGGTANFPGGWWSGQVRAVLNAVEDVDVEIDIQFGSLEPGDFGPDASDPPSNLDDSDVSYDSEDDEGTVTLSFDYPNADNFDPVGFAILRDGQFFASVPWTDGTTEYEYTDVVFNAGGQTINYTVQAYKYSGMLISAESNTVQVSFGGSLPDINVTGSGGITFGGEAIMTFIGNASGIYTLTPGKTNDTLYTHVGDDTTDVAIPEPRAKINLIQ